MLRKPNLLMFNSCFTLEIPPYSLEFFLYTFLTLGNLVFTRFSHMMDDHAFFVVLAAVEREAQRQCLQHVLATVVVFAVDRRREDHPHVRRKQRRVTEPELRNRTDQAKKGRER